MCIRDRPQIDFVQIEFQDVVLLERLLDPQRQDRFLDLALIGNFVGQQEVLCHLLRDCRCAHQAAACTDVAQVHHHRTGQRPEIDPDMVVESAILCRQKRVDDPLRR
eukprot:TRINITY_DN30260_c0_g1_i1.p1 TRINITY_DN30260_c0_g1~~TRINITY_DN30260_c0_g1_i1.p1  ORF type:complete len:107 (+),score=19.85 TRINITY_DN30260_c0_g1_i1:132-452(+)